MAVCGGDLRRPGRMEGSGERAERGQSLLWKTGTPAPYPWDGALGARSSRDPSSLDRGNDTQGGVSETPRDRAAAQAS